MVWRFMVVGLAALGAHFVSAEQGATPLVPATQTEGLAALESRAAAEASPQALTELAQAYIDRGQPGLATSCIEHASTELRAHPEIGYAYASALLRQALPAEALRSAKAARMACRDSESCPPWMLAKTVQQVAFLEEVVALGVVDPAHEPETMRAAFERSRREVGLVAMR